MQTIRYDMSYFVCAYIKVEHYVGAVALVVFARLASRSSNL